MSQLPEPARRYDEKEVRHLLERAAELQGSSPKSPSARGLSLRELEEIAAEAGLDVALLRQAARELDAQGPPGSALDRAFLGGPLKLVLERTLPFAAPESAFESLLPHMQMAASAPGQASQVGRTLTWQSAGRESLVNLQILVAVRRGETHIRIEERQGTFAAALFGGGLGAGSGIAIGTGGAIGGALGSVALGVGLPLGLIGGAYAALRAVFTRRSRTRRRTLEELMDRLVAELTHAAPQPD